MSYASLLWLTLAYDDLQWLSMTCDSSQILTIAKISCNSLRWLATALKDLRYLTIMFQVQVWPLYSKKKLITATVTNTNMFTVQDLEPSTLYEIHVKDMTSNKHVCSKIARTNAERKSTNFIIVILWQCNISLTIVRRAISLGEGGHSWKVGRCTRQMFLKMTLYANFRPYKMRHLIKFSILFF